MNNRRFFALASLLFILSAAAPRVHASTDVSFTTTRLNVFGSAAVEIGHRFGVDISGLIKPFYTKEGEIAHPDHTPTAGFKSSFNDWLTPQQYKDDGKHIDWDAIKNPIFYTSLYGAIIKVSADHSNNPPPTDCFISTGLEKSPPITDATLEMQKAQELDANLSLHKIDPNENGVIDFNQPSLVLSGMNPNEDCKKNQPGAEALPKGESLTALSSFGQGTNLFGEFITSIFTWVTKHWPDGSTTQEQDFEETPTLSQVILTLKKKLPYYNCMMHDAGGPENESGDCGVDAFKWGGWTASGLREEDMKPVEPASVQGYDIQVLGVPQGHLDASYDLKFRQENYISTYTCYGLPDTSQTTYDNIQKNFVIGGLTNLASALGINTHSGVENSIDIYDKCAPVVGNCPIDLIEQGSYPSDNACNLCNASSYTSSDTFLTPLEKEAFPNGIPPLMQKVLEAAGSTYHVPASVLLATMLEEGAFEHSDVWTWTDETVKEFSDCTIKDPMVHCYDEGIAHPVTGAAPPFGFIQNWWDQFIESGGPYVGLENDPEWKDIIANIPKENITQCNFVDAAFGAARELGEDASHYQPDFVPPAPLQCTVLGVNHNMNITNLPASCSSWDLDRVILARLQYGDRNCADPGVVRVAQTYDAISCH